MSEEEPLELGEPDKIILGGALQAGKKQIERLIKEAYEKGRADMRKEFLGATMFNGFLARGAHDDNRHLWQVFDDRQEALDAYGGERWQIKPVKIIEVEE